MLTYPDRITVVKENGAASIHVSGGRRLFESYGKYKDEVCVATEVTRRYNTFQLLLRAFKELITRHGHQPQEFHEVLNQTDPEYKP